MTDSDKHQFIKTGFHAKFILKFFLLFVISGIISGICLYNLTHSEMGVSYMSDHNKLKTAWDILLPTVIVTTLVTMTIVGSAIIYITLHASHKLAGPLFKFEKIVKDMKTGNFGMYTGIRDNDEFREFSVEMTQMVDNLKSRFVSIKKRVNAIKVEFSGIPSDNNLDEHSDILDKIEKLKKEVEFFKT